MALTEIELQLLQALSTGASNKQMARALCKSEFTVRNQLSVVFQKIGVANRTQAAFWCRGNLADTSDGFVGTSALLFERRAELRMGELS